MKRKIAILLVLALILSFIPAIVVHAAETTTVYQKISTLDELTTGKYVMVLSSGYAPTIYNSGWVEVAKPTVSGNEITKDNADGYIWDLTVSGTSVTLTDANGVSIKPSKTNGNGITNGSYSWTVSCSNGAFTFKGSGSYTVTLAANKNSSYKIRAYKNTTASDTTTYPSAFTLYKMTEVESGGSTETPPEVPTDPPVATFDGTFQKLTAENQLTTGKYVMIVNNGYAMTVYDSSKWVLSEELTVTGDSITNPAEAIVWDITVTDGTVTLKDSNGTYIAPVVGNDNGILTKEYGWDVEFTNGTFQFKGTGSDTTTLCANKNSESKFRAYKNSTVTGDPTTYPSYFTLYKLETPKALVGTSYSIRMMEPWALRTNIRFFTGTVESPTLLPLANIASYGAYAIIGHKFDNAETATVADLIADNDTKVYTSAAGNIAPGGADTATTVVFDFTDEIYTYRLDEKVYWVAYYEDAEGQVHYTDIKSTTIITVADTVGGQTNVSDEEKAVLASMKVLKQAVIDFRGEDADLGGTTYPAGVALNNSGISFNQNGAAGTYKFGTSHQIRLIEPWSIRVQMTLYDANTQKIDCATTDVNYGMIFYHDKTGAYADGMSVEQMIAEGDALVYSTQTNNIEIVGDSAVVVYDKGIYTYELDTNLYCLTYVEVEGQYYYRSEVICWNLLDQMETFSKNTSLSAEEIAVFEAMIDLHEKTLAYRAS